MRHSLTHTFIATTLLFAPQSSQANLDGIIDAATGKIVNAIVGYALSSDRKDAFCATGGDITKGEFSIGSFNGLLCNHRLWASLAMSHCWNNKSYRNGKLWQNTKCGQNAKNVLGKIWGNQQEANKLFYERLKDMPAKPKAIACKMANKLTSAGLASFTGGIQILPESLTNVCSVKK